MTLTADRRDEIRAMLEDVENYYDAWPLVSELLAEVARLDLEADTLWEAYDELRHALLPMTPDTQRRTRDQIVGLVPDTAPRADEREGGVSELAETHHAGDNRVHLR